MTGKKMAPSKPKSTATAVTAAATAAAAAAVTAANTASNHAVMLARIDERTKNIEAKLGELVSQAEFKPVKSIVYGLVSLVLVGVGTAVVTLVLRAP